MEEAVEAALAGGATVIQLREKNSSASEFLGLAQRVKLLTSRKRVPLIINDRIDIALAVGADGVHIGQTDIPAKLARSLIGPRMILGVSTRTVEQAKLAVEDGADYIGVGAVYGSVTKRDASSIGLEGLKAVRESVSVPIVAIGGISLGDGVARVMLSGADGVAVVGALFDTDDVREAARTLRTQVEENRRR